MRITKIKCDRCGKEYLADDCSQAPKYICKKLIGCIYYDIDLCDECTGELQEWVQKDGGEE